MTESQKWVSQSETSEIERLAKLIEHYEETYHNQISQIEAAQLAQENMAQNVRDLNATIAKLKKKINGLEGKIKFEKFAFDGLKKKMAGYELEARDFRNERDKLTVETDDQKILIERLENYLNENRCMRLKLMHENCQLKKKVTELHTRESKAEKESVDANKKLLEKLQQLETLTIERDENRKLMTSQSEELINLTNEIYFLKKKQLQKDNEIEAFHFSASEQLKIIDLYRLEISRLRKDLLSISGNHSEAGRMTSLIPYTKQTNQVIADRSYKLISPASSKTEREMNLAKLSQPKISSSKIKTISPINDQKSLINYNDTKSYYSQESGAPSRYSSKYGGTPLAIDITPSIFADPPSSSGGLLTVLDILSDDPHPEEKPAKPPSPITNLLASNAARFSSIYGDTANRYSNPGSKKPGFSEGLYEGSLNDLSQLTDPVYGGTIASLNSNSLSKTQSNQPKRSSFNTTPQSKILSRSLPALPHSVISSDQDTNSLDTVPMQGSDEKIKQKKVLNKSKSEQYKKQKTVFVGSGLGLKHNKELDRELANISKGSTKQMLSRILQNTEFS